MTKFSSEELEKLPLKHQARINPNLEIERYIVDEVKLPPVSTIKNRVNVVIFGENPEVGE
jgi:hypothetical protein